MTVKQFAEQRGIESGTVYVYISRHPEIKSHTFKQGKAMELDDEALRILSEQYPLPKPVQVVNGIPKEEHDALLKENEELLKKYNAVLEQVARIQTERLEERKKLVEAENRLQILEDRSQKAKNNEQQLLEDKAQAESELKVWRKQAEDEKAAREAAEAELHRIRSRGLWARIRNKE